MKPKREKEMTHRENEGFSVAHPKTLNEVTEREMAAQRIQMGETPIGRAPSSQLPE
jgi:hypothetical protein